jgi:hypothetical protein
VQGRLAWHHAAEKVARRAVRAILVQSPFEDSGQPTGTGPSYVSLKAFKLPYRHHEQSNRLQSLNEPPTAVRHPDVRGPRGMQHDTVVFAAGSQTESVKLRTEDLFRDEPVTIAPLTRYSAAGEELDEEGP